MPKFAIEYITRGHANVTARNRTKAEEKFNKLVGDGVIDLADKMNWCDWEVAYIDQNDTKEDNPHE